MSETEKTPKPGSLKAVIAAIIALIGAVTAYLMNSGEEATETPAKAGTVQLQPPTEPTLTEPEVVEGDTTTEETDE